MGAGIAARRGLRQEEAILASSYVDVKHKVQSSMLGGFADMT